MTIDLTVFHQTFFEEAADLLEALEGALLQLEEAPGDTGLLNKIFRCAHSIKGGSATFGFAEIAHFTNGLETLLDKVRKGQIAAGRPLAQLLLEASDQLKALFAVARGDAETAPSSAPIVLRIEAAIWQEVVAPPAAARAATAEPASFVSAGQCAETPVAIEAGTGETPVTTEPVAAGVLVSDATGGSEAFAAAGLWDAPRWRLSFTPALDILRLGGDPALLLGRLGEMCEIESIVCDQSRLPALPDLDPETSYLSWEVVLRSNKDRTQILEVFEFVADDSLITLEEAPLALEAAGDVAQAAGAEQSQAVPTPLDPAGAGGTTAGASGAAVSGEGMRYEAHTLRVSTEKVDRLMNLVGELTINQSRLNEIVKNFSVDKLPMLVDAVAQMDRASRELQERVMAVRMLPIKQAFARFHRLVRDLSAASGKQIELKTSGEDTELDKTIIEAIVDPLTHLIRNAADHGLCPPDERIEKGKPAVGTIFLHAFQEGGNIILEVSDDGRGLNRARIREKAAALGWIGPDDHPTDDTLFGFIFQPGFTTAEVVTDISGRGVGMDIVKGAIAGLGGSISVSSVEGRGTCFRIRLPLTMAIVDGLLLGVGSEVYVLPLTSIVESVVARPGDVRMIAGRAEVLQVRGEILPVLRLHRFFGSEARSEKAEAGVFVIVESDGKRAALFVDELITQSQVVIKSIESHYRKTDGLAGATILGDGSVALILDVPGLVRGGLDARG